MEIKKLHPAPLFKLRTSSLAETTVGNDPNYHKLRRGQLLRKSRENEAVNQDAVLFPQPPNLPENLSFHASSPQGQILQSS